MDCNTARLLLDFARRGPIEIEDTGAAELEQHLARCPDCDRHARAEARRDEVLGQAMRRVDVPPGLRDQLLARLEVERGDWYRRRFANLLRAAAAVAAMLLLVWGAWRWFASARTPLDPDHVWQEVSFHRPGRAEIELSFRRLDAPIVAPDLNYAYLTAYGLAELPGYPGRVVPQLVFTRDTRNAVVFVIDTRRYCLPDHFEPPSGSPYHIDRLEPGGVHFAYLVLYTGDDCGWLKHPEPPPA
jgi:hypothetical protein